MNERKPVVIEHILVTLSTGATISMNPHTKQVVFNNRSGGGACSFKEFDVILNMERLRRDSNGEVKS